MFVNKSTLVPWGLCMKLSLSQLEFRSELECRNRFGSHRYMKKKTKNRKKQTLRYREGEARDTIVRGVMNA